MRRIDPVNHGYDGPPARNHEISLSGDTIFSPAANEIKALMPSKPLTQKPEPPHPMNLPL
jgi:hypothetical protein